MEPDQIYFRIYQLKQQKPLVVVQPRNKLQREISRYELCISIQQRANYQFLKKKLRTKNKNFKNTKDQFLRHESNQFCPPSFSYTPFISLNSPYNKKRYLRKNDKQGKDDNRP